jgi:hypothetical protein
MPQRTLLAAISLPLAILSAAAAFAPRAWADGPPAAVIAALGGPATMTDASGNAQPAHVFDWVNPGTTLETGAGAVLTLAFANGRRYEMREKARLTVVAAGATNLSGPVRPLAPLPPMPKLPAVAPGSGASIQSGAVRVRSIAVVSECRYPREGYTMLADRAVLRFKAPAAAYRVEILDDSGNTIFQAETSSAEVAVPAGKLRAGVHYSWRLRASDASGTIRDRAEFTTLSDDEAARRVTFMAGFPERDADTLELLAQVDLRLGLLLDARDELRDAMAHSPHSDRVEKLLHEIESGIGGN